MNEQHVYKPYPIVERSFKDFAEQLKDHFLEKGFDSDLSVDLAYALTSYFAEEYTPLGSGPDSSVSNKATQYAIQGKALQLLDCFISGHIKAAAAAGYRNTREKLVSYTIERIVVDSAEFIRRLVKRGAQINKTDFKVLSAVQSSNVGTLDAITEKLNKMYESPDNPWLRGEVQRSLDNLEEISLLDGTIISLVRKDENDLWQVCGLES